MKIRTCWTTSWQEVTYYKEGENGEYIPAGPSIKYYDIFKKNKRYLLERKRECRRRYREKRLQAYKQRHIFRTCLFNKKYYI